MESERFAIFTAFHGGFTTFENRLDIASDSSNIIS